MVYDEDELLMLSGIQHYCFCKRQWALIHVEKQWQENVKTIEGKHIHEKVNDPYLVETRGDITIARSVPLTSYELGLYGIADVVEFSRVEKKGVLLKGKTGFWHPIPVEYKRGKPKSDERDEVQLCAQAICLEEMLHVSIEKGYLYYHQIRKRVEIELNSGLRETVKKMASDMHKVYKTGITPKGKVGKHCKLCSMENICKPKVGNKKLKVKDYVQKGVADK
ncbi:CRISPR-associated exonuclease Cas4 [Desulfitispora alkaliphila]|uniref:CRISPR-associated protein Cas4 n=1 Tax=Desulfitispora alkaliphila TaxID=622674 RepID=UPI003D190850